MLKDKSTSLSRRYLEEEISDTSLIAVMVYAMDQKLSGRLCVYDEHSVLRVFFERGAVIHSDSTREDERLGNLILQKGRLSQGLLVKAQRRQHGVPLLRRFMPEKRFGEILLSMGVISRAELKGFLEFQTKQRLLKMFSIGKGRFEFHIEEINRFALTDIPIEVDPRGIIYEGVKQYVDPRYLKMFYDRIRHAWPIRLRSELRNVSLSLTSKDAYILSRFEGASGIDDILHACNMPHDETLRTIFALFCCDVLSVADVQRDEVLKLQELRALELEAEGVTDSSRQLKLVPSAPPGLLPVLAEPHTHTANSFRLLWAKIRALHQVENRQVFCVTSADTQEGKTFLSTNLALACAESPDYKILLIDGDLHNPSVHKILGLVVGPGLSDHLTDKNPEKAASLPIKMFKVQRLHVLTAGSTPCNSNELFGSTIFRELLQRLRKEFQIIIVDSPPYLPLVDTKILTDLSDGILVSTRQGVTRLPNLRRLLQELESSKILGFIFNDAQQPESRKRYGNYYYHS